jgi:pyruvate,water dikinase
MLKKVDTKNKEVKVGRLIQGKQKITDNQIKTLAELGMKLEKHYGFPQDSEWSVVGNKVYIVQTRPITTVAATTKKNEQEKAASHQDLPLILSGAPASPGIATGPVKFVKSIHDVDKVMPGDVLVAPQTNPDYVPAMKKAVAIVTDKGGRTSHAAIVSRELGIPAVVGSETATEKLKSGEVITVDGGRGEVYRGGVVNSSVSTTRPIETDRIKTATKVYVNLAQPDLADKVAAHHVDGIGLLRAEFMMAQIGTHPRRMIEQGKSKIFIETLAENLEKFCAAFNPRPVVYRASDFKTNEYRGLVGGKEFEPVEPNPMLGFRGAYRYVHDPKVFELELEAIKIIRNKKNLKNLWLEIPFVRNVRELEDVKRLVTAAGLHRSPTFQLWMMVEIPSNVILLDQFIEAGIDGVSIGSNDLTMLMLGTDRDNSEVASEYNEQDPAVLWALEHVVKTAHKHGITSSICGQAPSLYPSLLEKLVKWGITSVSVSPDVIESVRKHVSEIEKSLLSK